MWNNLYPNQIIGNPAVIKELDCLTCTKEDIELVKSSFRMPLLRPVDAAHSRICGFAGWFDVHFRVRQLTQHVCVDACFCSQFNAFLVGKVLEVLASDTGNLM
jgi:hypothetical protein